MNEFPAVPAFVFAMLRAYHQCHDEPRLFEDPLATLITGHVADLTVSPAADDMGQRERRLVVAATDHYTHDRVTAALVEGCAQVVVLSTGFTSHAYLHSTSDAEIFEVDEPAVLEWKRHRLADAGVTVPERVRYVPVQSDLRDLPDRLTAAGFRENRSTIFCWLGTLSLIAPENARAVLNFVAALQAQLVFTYMEDVPDLHSPDARASTLFLKAMAAQYGIMLRNPRTPQSMSAELAEIGLPVVEDFDTPSLLARYGVRDGFSPLAVNVHVVLAGDMR